MSEYREGKLYEKINQAKPYVILIYKDQAVAILDEAAEEFPFNVYFDNAIDGDPCYSFCKKGGSQITDINEVTRGVAEWLERNFYGVKEKKGLYRVKIRTKNGLATPKRKSHKKTPK